MSPPPPIHRYVLRCGVYLLVIRCCSCALIVIGTLADREQCVAAAPSLSHPPASEEKSPKLLTSYSLMIRVYSCS